MWNLCHLNVAYIPAHYMDSILAVSHFIYLFDDNCINFGFVLKQCSQRLYRAADVVRICFTVGVSMAPTCSQWWNLKYLKLLNTTGDN